MQCRDGAHPRCVQGCPTPPTIIEVVMKLAKKGTTQPMSIVRRTRVLALAAVAAVVLPLAACGGEDESAQSSTSDAPSTTSQSSSDLEDYFKDDRFFPQLGLGDSFPAFDGRGVSVRRVDTWETEGASYELAKRSLTVTASNTPQSISALTSTGMPGEEVAQRLKESSIQLFLSCTESIEPQVSGFGRLGALLTFSDEDVERAKTFSERGLNDGRLVLDSQENPCGEAKKVHEEAGKYRSVSAAKAVGLGVHRGVAYKMDQVSGMES